MSAAAHVDVAVVGAGPAGAVAARRLAASGARVLLFDGRGGREKPCGGGVTPRAIAEVEEVRLLASRGRRVDTYVFETDRGRRVPVSCDAPSLVFARRDLDGGLRDLAAAAGAAVVARSVREVHARRGRWDLRDDAGCRHEASVLVAADGAGSAVRKALFPETPVTGLPCQVMYVDGSAVAENEVLFPSDLPGYLWTFPRHDHLSVGICAGGLPAGSLVKRLKRYAAERLGIFRTREPHRIGGFVPSRTAGWPAPAARVDGAGVVFVGDAAGLCDPLTGEGIAPALRSAVAAAEAIEAGDLGRYAAWVASEIEPEVARASLAARFFFAPAFLDATLWLASRSAAIQGTLAELILGTHGYRGLSRRLLSRIGPAVAELTTRL